MKKSTEIRYDGRLIVTATVSESVEIDGDASEEDIKIAFDNACAFVRGAVNGTGCEAPAKEQLPINKKAKTASAPATSAVASDKAGPFANAPQSLNLLK